MIMYFNDHKIGWLTKGFMRSLKHTIVGQKKKKEFQTHNELKIWNQLQWKDRVDLERTRLTLIEELTWSNLGLIKVFKR